jgi:LysW-gamma-L-lysine carboxypeptidase
VWGRGAVDAKGPLCAFVGAAARLASHPQLKLVVVGCMDEEGPSVGARALLGRHRPEALVIGEPSGTDGVTLGYRGIARFHYALEDDLVHGAGEHAGVPDRAFAFWQEVQAWLAPRQGPSPFTTPTGRLGSFRTQALPGGRVRADLVGAVRLPPGFPTEELLDAMRGAAGKASLAIDEVEPPWESPRDSALARAFVAAVREQGVRPRLVRKTGTSDMNVLAPVWKVPAVAYGPGDSRLDHTPHERLSLQDYRTSIRVLTAALGRYAAGP